MPRNRWTDVLGVCFLVCCLAIVFLPSLRCVVEGTTIDTPFGARAIEDLKVGDLVWSRDLRGELSTSTVSAAERSFTLRYLRFALADGRKLEVTASHPLAVGGEWIEAGSVARADLLEGRSGSVAATRVDSVISWTAVYDITVAPHANFFANGVLVHNKSIYNPEAVAIGDTRSVISLLMTYASANCGFFPGDLTGTCRTDGSDIGIPDYPEDAPEFLGPDLARPSPYVKGGYRRTYQAFGRPDMIPPECDPASALAFCYTSTPIRPFRSAWLNDHPWLAEILPVDWFRRRTFVATSDGAIYMDLEGRDLACIDGKPPDYAVRLE